MPDDIAFVCYFRNLIINALQRTIDEKRFKKIHRALEDRYSYTLMKRYYNNFCTQWVDIQNVKYLKRAPEKRKTYLATISEKILFDNSDYDALEDGECTGVIARDISRSHMFQHIIDLMYEGAITVDDLKEFSEDLRDTIKTRQEIDRRYFGS